ncbi:MAG: hypothetical protein ACLQGP_03720 [Isosphaeraceae bacterium]
MRDATYIERIRDKFLALDAVLDERSRRQWGAAEARDYGYGGVTAVAAATGLARDTIATRPGRGDSSRNAAGRCGVYRKDNGYGDSAPKMDL